MGADISLAETEDEISATWPVMRQLRPHLDGAGYLALVQRLRTEQDFRLARMRADGEIVAVAGLRIGEWLHGGRYLEIEDFVTAAACRSRGHGRVFFDWIAEFARHQGCRHLRLTSGVQREAAHRFYRRQGMSLDAYYFSIDL
jgi:GNAT superfamily N-acetyltransferase